MSESAGPLYSVTFKNNSPQTGTVCLYQRPLDHSNALPLVWFTSKTHPAFIVVFQWRLDYSFIWSMTGRLMPGVMVMPSQTLNADLNGLNMVTFGPDAYHNFTLKDLTSGPQPGSLTIRQESMIPVNTATVGIGMSGAGTFVVQAAPNSTTVFTPHPNYWIAFSTFPHSQGDVLDLSQVSDTVQINFPPGVYSMTAVLNMDNSWTVLPTSMVNDRADSEIVGAEDPAS